MDFLLGNPIGLLPNSPTHGRADIKIFGAPVKTGRE
jgi:hypothetical protein